MSDKEIVDLIRKNQHHAAIHQLYDCFPKINSLIRSKGGNKDDAYDMFQESIVIFCRKAAAPDFQLTSSISTYLYSVCWFLWKDVLKKRLRNVSLESTILLDTQAADTAQEYMEQEEKFKCLDQVLMQIEQKCRQIFQFYYFDKLSMRQIADNLGLNSEQAAKNQKYKCMERAKELARQILSIHEPLRP